MGAKIQLIGKPEKLRIEGTIVTFHITTGPSVKHAPKGLQLFGETTYVVQCTRRQLNRGRASENDDSELIIEGYQEPRVDKRSGRPRIAVVAMSLTSMRKQNERKLAQISDQFVKAEEEYAAAYERYGGDSPEARAALEGMEKVKGNLLKFLERHPELKRKSLF